MQEPVGAGKLSVEADFVWHEAGDDLFCTGGHGRILYQWDTLTHFEWDWWCFCEG